MRPIPTRIEQLVEPVISGLGYELVGVEFDTGSRILRIYIDSSAGITVDDCSKVSYQISGLLDVEDPIPGEYRLEISSPGLDRPLYKLADFERYLGHLARVQTRLPIEQQRNFKGRICGIENNDILLNEDGKLVKIPAHLVAKARLIPEF